MVGTSGDLGDRADLAWKGHECRCGVRFSAPVRGVTELADAVVAEGVELAGGSERKAVVGAGRDLGDVADLAWQRYECRCGVRFFALVVGGAAKLSKVVVTEGVELAGGRESEAVVAAGGDLGDVSDLAWQRYECRCGVWFFNRVVGRVTELTVVVVTEGVELAGGRESEAVVVAGGDLGDRAGVAWQRYECRCGVRFCWCWIGGSVGSVTELAVVVVAEGVEMAGSCARCR